MRRYPGLKEEYYLHGFAPDPSVLDELGLDRERVVVASALLRRYRSITATETRCSPTCSTGSAQTKPCTPSSSRVRQSSATRSRHADSRRSSFPIDAIDAQSLVALADLVVSAGGTMNREAVALGVPAYTTFAGRLGAVDDGLVREGRLELLESVDALRLEKRAGERRRRERDPALLLDLVLTAL